MRALTGAFSSGVSDVPYAAVSSASPFQSATKACGRYEQ